MITRNTQTFGAAVLLLVLVAPGAAAARLDLRSQTLESTVLSRTLRFDVLLPAGYDASEDRYPVLYLLHGVGGDHRSWSHKGGVMEHADRSGPWIVVMPEAGASWYVNWQPSENQRHGGDSVPGGRWEDYLIDELIPHVDRSFRTLARREGRAIAGFSMGGYGALVLGLRHPHLFASIGSSSGYLDYARGFLRFFEHGDVPRPRRRSRAVSNSAAGLAPPPGSAHGTRNAGSRGRSLRPPFAGPAAAAAHDPYHLIHAVAREDLPHIVLDCGLDDVLMPFTRELAEVLLAAGIPFQYLQLPGGHDSTYLERAQGHVLPIHRQALRRALAGSASAGAMR